MTLRYASTTMADRPSTTVKIHRSIAEIPGAVWDALDGVRDAPFLSHAWLSALEATGCVSPEVGWLPHHLSFWEGDHLIAVAPTYLKGNSEGEFVFDHSWADAAERAGIHYYPKLLVAVPFTPATATRLLVRDPAVKPRLLPLMAEVLRGLVNRLGLSSAHVLFPPAAEAEVLADAGLAHRYGLQFQWQNAGYACFDDFLGKFSSKRRNQLKRERREMSAQGIVICTERGPFPPALIDTVYTFYRATVAKFSWGRRYLNRAFFEEVCASLPGKIELVLAREGARILGGAFNLVGESTLYGRYWGATEERPFLHFNVCYYHPIDECIRRGFRRFEPGAGGEHKLVRGFEPVITHSAHFVAHEGLDRAVRAYLERERAHVEESAKQSDVAFR
jgi:predicted N-acyltransferase